MLILRAIVLALWFFGSSFFLVLIAVFRPFSTKNSELFCRVVCPVALQILGIRVVTRHIDKLAQSQPCVFIVNHQHLIDAFVVGFVLPPKTVTIGKKSLKWIPLFGWLYYLSGSLLIDRKNNIRAVATMKEAQGKLKLQKLSVLLAPEGTRSGTKPMGPFKKGAFYLAIETGFALQPMVISSFHRGLDFWRWHAGMVIIEALEPISTEGKSLEDVENILTLAHHRMKEAADRLDAEVTA